MLCAIYKSPVKADTYLYVERRDDFAKVPEKLLVTFGQPQFVMLVDLNKRQKLALVEVERLEQQLQQQGFYLQLPPPEENLLKQHLAQQAKR